MKRLAILAAVFVVLLGVLALQRWQRSKIVVSGPMQTVKVDPEKVTKVLIHKTDGDVELQRVGSEWKVTRPAEYPANSDLVKGMLKAVEELKLEDVISSNPATRGTYQVDSTGTAVTMWSGDAKALDVVVGKSTADWTHTFVRYADRNEVYRADGVLSYNFNRRPEDWRDKSILHLEEKQIDRIVLGYPKDGRSIVLARADSTHWNVQEGGATAHADSATAARLVSNVARLSTVNFGTAAEAAGKDFMTPDFRLQVDSNGGKHQVDFVAVDENKMLARQQGNETLYSLYKSNLANVMVHGEQLRTGKAPEPTVAPAKAPAKAKAKPAAAAAPKKKKKKT